MRILLKIMTILLLATITLSSCAQIVTRNIKKDFGAKGDGSSDDHIAFRKAAKFINARKGNTVLEIPPGTYMVGQILKKPLNIKGDVWTDTNFSIPDSTDIFSLKQCTNVTIKGAAGAQVKLKDGIKFGAFDPLTGELPGPQSAKVIIESDWLKKGFDLILPPHGYGLLTPPYRTKNNKIKRDTINNTFSQLPANELYKHQYNITAYWFAGYYHFNNGNKIDSAFVNFTPTVKWAGDKNVSMSSGSIFKFYECKKINISNITIDGNSRNHVLGGSYNSALPQGYEMHATAIYIGDCADIKIDNVRETDFGTIGLHIKNRNDYFKDADQGIVINNSSFSKNGWANFYVSGGKGIQVNSSKFDSSGFAAKGKIKTAPLSGMGFEDETGKGVKNVTINNCTSLYNNGSPFNNAYENDASFVVKNSSFHAFDDFTFIAAKDSYFENCKFFNPINYYNSNLADRNKVEFVKCFFTDSIGPSSNKNPAKQFLFGAGVVNSVLRFDGCVFETHFGYFDYIPGSAKNMVSISNCSFTQFHTKTAYAYAYMNGAKLTNNTFNIAEGKNNKRYIEALQNEKSVRVKTFKGKDIN